MQIILIISGIVIGSLCGWWATQSHERTKNRAKVRDLESKYRFSQVEMGKLKERMAGMRGEVVALQKSLESERKQSAHQLSQLGTSFKKGVMFLGVAYFAVGLSLGGVGAWYTAQYQTEAKHIIKNSELRLESALARNHIETLKGQVRELNERLDQTRKALTDTKIEKEVLFTKLRILLESLSPTKGIEGFTLNYQKLRKNLKSSGQEQSLQPELPVLKIGM